MSHCAGTKCQSWTQVYCHSWCEQCDWCVIPIAQMSGSAGCPSRRRVWFDRDATKSMAASALAIFKMYIWGVQQALKSNVMTWDGLWGKVPPEAGEGPCLQRDSADALQPSGIPCLPQAEYGELRAQTGGAMQEALLGSLLQPCTGTECENCLSRVLVWPLLNTTSVASMGRAKGFWQQTLPCSCVRK